MNNSRREFLKKLPLAMSIPFTIGGISMRALGQDDTLAKLAAASTNDKILIILQMHGGNDGLNCVIPVAKYTEYYNARPNIAIPEANSLRKYVALDSTLPDLSKVGLHPDMLAMKGLYDQGRMSIVQGVSYKNNNGSHFRGRDIRFMGGGADDYFQSGWLGRFLQDEYLKSDGITPYKYPEEFPINPDMLDPLALEMGTDVSLIFHQEGNIPTSISVEDIPDFAKLVGELDGFNEERLDLFDPRGIPPETITNFQQSAYYKELRWILDLEDKSKDYAGQLAKEYIAGKETTITYPDLYPYNAPDGSLHNPLTGHLKTIARLLSGGCKTKVFMVKIGGFDTHANQVEKYDTTMGGHAALMYHISTGMKAFQDDLRARGLEDRVLTVTTSEFGRRVKSNGSYGTDHGVASPTFLFGKGVKPGVVGEAFVTTDTFNNNLGEQYDYRLVYANIMKNWMGVSDDKRMNKIFPNGEFEGDYTRGIMDQTQGTSDGVKYVDLGIVSNTILGNEGFIGDRFSLEDCYPNPAKTQTTVHFKVNSAYHVNVDLFSPEGKKIKAMVNGFYNPGEHKVEVDLTGLPPGNYIYEFKTGFYKEAKKLIITR